MDDPARARAIAREVYHLMQRRISLLVSLPIETLDRMSLQAAAGAIAAQASTSGGPAQ
jgi:hypothetical protein